MTKGTRKKGRMEEQRQMVRSHEETFQWLYHRRHGISQSRVCEALDVYRDRMIQWDLSKRWQMLMREWN